MFFLYLIGSFGSLYFLIKKLTGYIFLSYDRSLKFESEADYSIEYIEYIYHDNSRKIDYNFEENLDLTPFKYIVIVYSVNDESYKCLCKATEENYNKLKNIKLYDTTDVLPLYKEIKKVILTVDKENYDITESVKTFEGANMNYHKHLFKISFEDIIDYANILDEIIYSTGSIIITDNFENLTILSYPGFLEWDENILTDFDFKDSDNESNQSLDSIE